MLELCAFNSHVYGLRLGGFKLSLSLGNFHPSGKATARKPGGVPPQAGPPGFQATR